MTKFWIGTNLRFPSNQSRPNGVRAQSTATTSFVLRKHLHNHPHHDLSMTSQYANQGCESHQSAFLCHPGSNLPADFSGCLLTGDAFVSGPDASERPLGDPVAPGVAHQLLQRLLPVAAGVLHTCGSDTLISLSRDLASRRYICLPPGRRGGNTPLALHVAPIGCSSHVFYTYVLNRFLTDFFFPWKLDVSSQCENLSLTSLLRCLRFNLLKSSTSGLL